MRWLIICCVAGLVAGCSSATGGQGSAPPSSPSSTSSADFPSSTPATSTVPPPPTTGVASTVTVTAPPPSVTVPAGFVGSWYGHGRGLTISSAGAVSIEFRTYVNCTATVTTGCDKIAGNQLIEGGHVSGRLSQVINSTTVMVTLTSSTAPAELAPGTYRLGHDLGHHALALFAGQWNRSPFCGTGSPVGYCGA